MKNARLESCLPAAFAEFGASATLTLSRASKTSPRPGALTLNVAMSRAARVGRRCAVAQRGITVRDCDTRVRALDDQHLVVKQRPGRTCGAGEGHCLGWFLPTLREISGGWPLECPVRLAPSGQGALKAVTDRARYGSRDNSR